jgi:hypothetical protein
MTTEQILGKRVRENNDNDQMQEDQDDIHGMYFIDFICHD